MSLRLHDVGSGALVRSAVNDAPLAILAASLVYIGIFLRDIIAVWLPFAGSIALAAGIALSMFAVALKTLETERIVGAGWAVGAVVLWLLTFGFTHKVNLSNYYFAPVIAVLIFNVGLRTFFALLLAHLVATLLTQAWEYASGSYLFIHEAIDGTQLDETLFAGALDTFRAKGLFQGPLSAVAFASWMAFLYRGSVTFAIVMFVVAFLAGGRLGMTVAACLLVLRLPFSMAVTRGRVILTIWPLLLIVTLLIMTADSDRLMFIASAFDLDNPSNVARFFVWSSSVDHFTRYDWQQLLFGNFDFIREEEGTTESDLLRILLDNGIAGVAFYFLAIVMLFKSAYIDAARESLVVLAAIILMTLVFPFAQSLNSTVMFWLFVLLRAQAHPNNLRYGALPGGVESNMERSTVRT